ncbi:DUF5317 domain-containing protein [Caldisalinibacter kiritimatiensis]|uniref:DUF5317 domain-containing protein n=1 Tax=Caldisalinibacter kiritimatiensis TaxID=1304284 RepID=R1CSH5_9FIRM|nr:DUF5317 domain-containing protein [Caldisalinibacter kiritimatiensis]EOC99658.1 hypothetical protein L21TH_2301 [Caldisalinibacter kiritimatiensis]
MLVESMATSVIVGKARGGKVKNIEKINIKAWYLFILGFILEFTSVYLYSNKIGNFTKIIDNYFIYIHGFSYLLIFIGLILNFNKKSLVLVFIGTLLNFIVITANGGQMPVSGAGLENLGLMDQLNMLKQESIATHTLVTDSSKLVFLGDIIPIPKPYPLPKMISIGDIFIALGIFFFLQGAMVNRKLSKHKPNMIRFQYKSKNM